jgi:acetyl-CoA synthetase
MKKDKSIHAKESQMSQSKYHQLYQRSIQDSENFWAEQAKENISWFSPWQQVLVGKFEDLNTQWFIGGKLNACYNCLDRHLETRRDQIAIIWEGDDPTHFLKITYGELYERVCRFANVLKNQGVQRGDRVCIYLPMIPEIIIAILACARIGAIHSVVFAGFSAESLKTRILDADCQLLITADEGVRGGQLIPLKKNTDEALKNCLNVKKVIVVKRTGNTIPWHKNRDLWYHELLEQVNAECEPEPMDSEDPLFILYTSGSTGKPKGILHAVAGYLVYVAFTFKLIFDYQDQDIYWCTADLGWITGHSYLLYGPLANGATTVVFEGAPHYPRFSRFWEIIDKYQVNIFYTSPTALRALRREGDEWVKKTNRKTLKLLGTVGEPINPQVWNWYFEVVGEGRCPIVDTWWQTETGGILISPLPRATPLKPGSAAWPFFGIIPEIVDETGETITDHKPGKLVIKQAWPGFMKTIYRDQKRFVDTYFKKFPGKYLTGDIAYCDEDGYYWIIGRDDDVIKVSGHRLSTGELESALLSVTVVAEAAVVAIHNEIKGQGIYAFVVLKQGEKTSEDLKQKLINHVRKSIGAIATPEKIQWATGLPKTRSGKIMRRILRQIANGEFDDLGDTSTLADPSVIDDLIQAKKAS